MLFDLTYKLNSGERLAAVVRKHWFLIIPKVAEFLIIISLLIIFANKFISPEESFAIAVILIACFAIYFIYSWVMLHVDYYIITSERILRIKHRGVWNRSMSEISISDINAIILNEKGIAATLLKFGSIKIDMRGADSFTMANIADPVKIYQGLIRLKGIIKA